MGPYKVSNYSTTEGEKGFGNRDYEATTTFSVTLSIDATRMACSPPQSVDSEPVQAWKEEKEGVIRERAEGPCQCGRMRLQVIITHNLLRMLEKVPLPEEYVRRTARGTRLSAQQRQPCTRWGAAAFL